MDELTILPATAERWADVVGLFERPGEPKRCWCTYFRFPKPVWRAMPVAGRREAFEGVVASAAEPGLLTSMFARAGFTEIDRRGVRPLYRLSFHGAG